MLYRVSIAKSRAKLKKQKKKVLHPLDPNIPRLRNKIIRV
jgi:hypothetical protein